MGTIKQLRWWAYKILPLVYDDSLSYYEVISKVTQKLNEVVDTTNKLPDAISEEIKNQLSGEEGSDVFDNLFSGLINAIATKEADEVTYTPNEKQGGELVWLGDTLYEVTSPMASGTNYIVGTNIVPVDISDELKEIKAYISTHNEYFHERASEAHNAQTYLYWKDNLYRADKDINVNDILGTDGQLTAVNTMDEITSHYHEMHEADNNLQTQIDGNDGDIKNLQNKDVDLQNQITTNNININTRVDNIVAQAGTDNTEIVDARSSSLKYSNPPTVFTNLRESLIHQITTCLSFGYHNSEENIDMDEIPYDSFLLLDPAKIEHKPVEYGWSNPVLVIVFEDNNVAFATQYIINTNNLNVWSRNCIYTDYRKATGFGNWINCGKQAFNSWGVRFTEDINDTLGQSGIFFFDKNSKNKPFTNMYATGILISTLFEGNAILDGEGKAAVYQGLQLIIAPSSDNIYLRTFATTIGGVTNTINPWYAVHTVNNVRCTRFFDDLDTSLIGESYIGFFDSQVKNSPFTEKYGTGVILNAVFKDEYSDYNNARYYQALQFVTIPNSNNAYIRTFAITADSELAENMPNPWWPIFSSGNNIHSVEIGIGTNYPKLRDGIPYAESLSSADNPVTVYVKPGTYNILEEFATEIANRQTTGIELKNHIHVIFEQGAYVTCIHESSGTYDSEAIYFNNDVQVFYAQYDDSFILENANIHAKNVRYCVHDEHGGGGTYYSKYINCNMLYEYDASKHFNSACIGMGLGLHGTIVIDGGHYVSKTTAIDSSIFIHNGNGTTNDNKITIQNILTGSSIMLGELGSSDIITDAYINNCKCKSIDFIQAAAGTKITVKCYNYLNDIAEKSKLITDPGGSYTFEDTPSGYFYD